VSLPQNAETLAQWQVDSSAIDYENGSYSLRWPVHDQIVESDGMEIPVFREYSKQITGREAVLVDDVDGK
jgi:hypothetical protein